MTRVLSKRRKNFKPIKIVAINQNNDAQHVLFREKQLNNFKSRLLFRRIINHAHGRQINKPSPFFSTAEFKSTTIENFPKVESRQSASVVLRAKANVCLKTVPLFLPCLITDKLFNFFFLLSPRQRKNETKCQVKHQNVVSKVRSLRFNYKPPQTASISTRNGWFDSIKCKTTICFISPLKWICILQIGNQFPLKLAQCFLIFVNCFLDCSSSIAVVVVYSERLGGFSSVSAATLDRANGKLKFHVALNCKIILRKNGSIESWRGLEEFMPTKAIWIWRRIRFLSFFVKKCVSVTSRVWRISKVSDFSPRLKAGNVVWVV